VLVQGVAGANEYVVVDVTRGVVPRSWAVMVSVPLLGSGDGTV
jgi:hypothetical protein